MAYLKTYLEREDAQELELKISSFKDNDRDIFFEHYTKSGGMVGRRIVYDIIYKNKQVGIISGMSVATFYRKAANYFYNHEANYKYTKEEKFQYMNEVITNNIFRLYYNEHNLASRVLSLFRKKIYVDWYEKYHVRLRGIISLSFADKKNPDRIGKCFIADNWVYLGQTEGKRIHHDYASKKWNVVYDGVKKEIYLWDYKKRYLDRKKC